MRHLMRLTFLGATHEVTGSCYYLEAAGKKFLVDCGMEQGPNIYENKPIPVPASQLDFVLITHAHIDHTGNLPLLYAHEKQRKCRLRSSRCGWSAAAHRHYKKQRRC